MTAEREALIVILENQMRLADIIVNGHQLLRAELQDQANWIGAESGKAIGALRVADQQGAAHE